MSSLTSNITCHINPQYLVNIQLFKYSDPIGFVALIMNGSSSVVATFLNLLILTGILTSPKKLTPTFILLSNLALTDLLFGIIIGLMNLVHFWLKDVEQMCTSFKAYAYLDIFLGSSSLYTITCISYDRYLSIEMQSKYRYIVTNNRTYKVAIAVWLVSLLSPLLMSFLGKRSFTVSICCVQALCLLIIVDCYLLCFQNIKGRQKEIKESFQTNYEMHANMISTRPREDNAYSAQERNEISLGDLRSNNVSEVHTKHIEKISSNEKPIETSLIMGSGIIDNNTFKQNGQNVSMGDSLCRLEKTKNGAKETSLSANFAKGTEGLKFVDPKRPEKIRMEEDREISDAIEKEGIVSSSDASKGYQRNCTRESLNDDRSQLSKVDRLSDDVASETETTKRGLKPTDRSKTNGIRTLSQIRKEIIVRRKAKKTKKRRPHSLLQDIKQFRKSLNTILIIVFALFICYLPFLVINILMTLKLISQTSPWYFLALNFVFFHSCISPVVLCIRIGRIQDDFRRVLKKMWCCRFFNKN